jgi:hypothetical protein
MENLGETWPEFVMSRDLLGKNAETTANNVGGYKVGKIKEKMEAVKDFGEVETPRVAKDVANSLRNDIIANAEKSYWKWNAIESLEYYNSPLARVLKLTDDVMNSEKVDYMKLEQLKELHDYLNPEGIQFDIKGNAVSEAGNLMSAGKRSKLQQLLEERWAEKWVNIKQINRDIQWAYAMEQGLIKADSRMGNLNMMWLWDTQTAVVSAILWWAPGAVLWVMTKKALWSEWVKSYVAKKLYSKPKQNDQTNTPLADNNTSSGKSRVDRIMDNSPRSNNADTVAPAPKVLPNSYNIPGSRKTIIETPLNPKWNTTSALAGKKGVLVWDSKPTLQLPARTPSGIKIRQSELQSTKSDIAEATRTRRMGDDGTDIVFQKVSELIDSKKITEKEWIQIMKEIVAEKGTPDGQKYFWVDKNYLEGIIKDLTGEKTTAIPQKKSNDPFEELRKEEPKNPTMPKEKPKTQEQEAQEWQMSELKKEWKIDSVYWPELDRAYASLKWSENRTGLSKTQDRYSQIEENSSQNKQFKAFSDAVSEYNHRTGKEYSVQEMKDIMDKQGLKKWLPMPKVEKQKESAPLPVTTPKNETIQKPSMSEPTTSNSVPEGYTRNMFWELIPKPGFKKWGYIKIWSETKVKDKAVLPESSKAPEVASAGKGMDTIVDQRTGQTLWQAIEGLRKNNWSEKDIAKFEKAVLGNYKWSNWPSETKTPEYSQATKGSHTAPVRWEETAPIHEIDKIYPKDIYEKNAEKRYSSWYRDMDTKAIKIIHDIRANPEKMVTIYRTVRDKYTDTEINPGDWVSLTKEYAIKHGESNLWWKYRLITKEVKAWEVISDGNSIQEFWYDPMKPTIKKSKNK